MEELLERYKKDKDVLESIIKEKNIYKTQNIKPSMEKLLLSGTINWLL